MKKLLTLPNILTSLRIVGAVLMLFIPPLTAWFFVIYTLCGVSDVLDGVIARARHAESEFGSRLDSVADLLFYAVMILRIFPVLWERLPRVIWIFVASVLLLRAASYLTAAIKHRRFASLHTYLNKATGFGVFMIPYFISLRVGTVYCFVACAVGGIASAEELLIHIICREYAPGIRGLWDLRKKRRGQEAKN